MKNVTITMTETLLKHCKHKAVEEDKSLSKWISDTISEIALKDDKIDQAKQNAIKMMSEGLALGGKSRGNI